MIGNNLSSQNQEDMGLGDKVVQENRTRFINKDGSFNVHSKGMFERGSFSPYHAILSTSWPRFFLGVLGYYLFVNLAFTFLYMLCGRSAFPLLESFNIAGRFGQLFYYSVQIISTLGSSPLHPATTASQIVLALESMIGLFGFALGASLMFARFSNPSTKILFSEKAVISPYNKETGFMVRIINGRSNELINVEATLTLAMQDENGKRQFKLLSLERNKVLIFPLNWTIVHPINTESPLHKLTEQDLAERDAEFVLAITGTDQDISRVVYSRTSYIYDEVLVGAKFASIIERDSMGTVIVDPSRVSEIE
jgi:inward rectifier potassium channel